MAMIKTASNAVLLVQFYPSRAGASVECPEPTSVGAELILDFVDEQNGRRSQSLIDSAKIIWPARQTNEVILAHSRLAEGILTNRDTHCVPPVELWFVWNELN
jgi:hypothetical protein